MKLLHELENHIQTQLKSSDGTDAGTTDTKDTTDVRFSLMRNMINRGKDGSVNGSDVNDYLERAAELNDQVDSVGFVVKTNEGDYIEIYVNAQEADEFEKALSNLLGMDNDIETAINQMATQFDIVDVVWPTENGDQSVAQSDDTADIDTPELDSFIDRDSPAANIDNGDAEEGEPTPNSPEENKLLTPDETETEGETEPEGETEGDEESEKSGEESEDEENADKKKEKKEKKKKKKEGEEGEESAEGETETEVKESLAADVAAHVEKMLSAKKWVLRIKSTGGINGLKEYLHTKDGKVMKYPSIEEAERAAQELSTTKNAIGAKSSFSVQPELEESLLKEANDLSDGVRDGLSMKLDAQGRAFVSRLKLPLAKQIAAFFQLVGIPGRYYNNAEAAESVTAGAEFLRQHAAAKTAFIALYKALGKEAGFDLAEATSHRRGDMIQRLLEAVLVKLGLPEELVVQGGPAVVNTFLHRVAMSIEGDPSLELLLRRLANRLSVSASSSIEPVAEDVQLSSDSFIQGVSDLLSALGIPDANLNYQKTQLITAIRAKKQTLTSPGLILQKIQALTAIVTAGTKQPATQPATQTPNQGE